MIDHNMLPTECDWLCEYRECLQKEKNLGYDKAKYVCITKHVKGCPEGNIDGRPAPDWHEVKKDLFEKIEKMPKTKKVNVGIRKIETLVDAMLKGS